MHAAIASCRRRLWMDAYWAVWISHTIMHVHTHTHTHTILLESHHTDRCIYGDSPYWDDGRHFSACSLTSPISPLLHPISLWSEAHQSPFPACRPLGCGQWGWLASVWCSGVWGIWNEELEPWGWTFKGNGVVTLRDMYSRWSHQIRSCITGLYLLRVCSCLTLSSRSWGKSLHVPLHRSTHPGFVCAHQYTVSPSQRWWDGYNNVKGG